MKSILVYVFIFALVGGGLCGRLRRQAPPAAVDYAVDDAAVDGATPPPPPSTADKLNAVVAGMLLDMNNKAALGEPVDPKDMDKVMKLSMVISIVGGELSEPNRQAIEDILTATPEPVVAPEEPAAPEEAAAPAV